MKIILITGANGQLGKKIRDISSEYSQYNFLFTDVEQLDITSRKDVETFFIAKKPDAVINCAAYTNVDNAEDDFDTACLINETGPGLLAEYCNKYSAEFIHISTDYVFEGNATVPYKEIDETNPVSAYGVSKLKGELAVTRNLKNSIIVRTSWLYSEYGKNFALTILKYAKEKEQLKVVYDQIGTPTYAGDLAKAVLDMLEPCFSHNNANIYGVYHYSNLGVCSWYDFALFLLKSENIKTPVLAVDSSEFPVKAKRPSYSVFYKTKTISKFKIKIPYWTESCREMLSKI